MSVTNRSLADNRIGAEAMQQINLLLSNGASRVSSPGGPTRGGDALLSAASAPADQLLADAEEPLNAARQLFEGKDIIRTLREHLVSFRRDFADSLILRSAEIESHLGAEESVEWPFVLNSPDVGAAVDAVSGCHVDTQRRQTLEGQLRSLGQRLAVFSSFSGQMRRWRGAAWQDVSERGEVSADTLRDRLEVLNRGQQVAVTCREECDRVLKGLRNYSSSLPAAADVSNVGSRLSSSDISAGIQAVAALQRIRSRTREVWRRQERIHALASELSVLLEEQSREVEECVTETRSAVRSVAELASNVVVGSSQESSDIQAMLRTAEGYASILSEDESQMNRLQSDINRQNDVIRELEGIDARLQTAMKMKSDSKHALDESSEREKEFGSVGEETLRRLESSLAESSRALDEIRAKKMSLVSHIVDCAVEGSMTELMSRPSVTRSVLISKDMFQSRPAVFEYLQRHILENEILLSACRIPAGQLSGVDACLHLSGRRRSDYLSFEPLGDESIPLETRRVFRASMGGRLVALKKFSLDQRRFFTREVRTPSSLRHPCVIRMEGECVRAYTSAFGRIDR